MKQKRRTKLYKGSVYNKTQENTVLVSSIIHRQASLLHVYTNGDKILYRNELHSSGENSMILTYKMWENFISIIKETAATKNLNISENITQNYQETQ